MKRDDIYNKVVSVFKESYDWLGEQYAKEMLLSLASWNIQCFSEPHFRVRRHLLLFWSPGWIKSSLLDKTYKLLGPELAVFMSDVTLAALRGTVESGRFVTPYTIKRPFAICTEFGQIVTGSESQETTQKLLNVLEEGIVTVSLAKIATLSLNDRRQIEHDFGITFIDSNTFTYRTNWVMLAGTYNKKYLVDNALEERFQVMLPERKLDSDLAKKIISAQPKGFDAETVAALRHELLSQEKIKIDSKLPDEVFEAAPQLNMRNYAQILSFKLCNRWWNIEVPDEELIEFAKRLSLKSEQIWKTTDDMVFDSILYEPKPAKQIADELNVSIRQVYYSLRNIKASKIVDDDGVKWTIL